VIDLAGCGMARWTEVAQAKLLKSLGGVPAVQGLLGSIQGPDARLTIFCGM
jgi:hypothetical protein